MKMPSYLSSLLGNSNKNNINQSHCSLNSDRRNFIHHMSSASILVGDNYYSPPSSGVNEDDVVDRQAALLADETKKLFLKGKQCQVEVEIFYRPFEKGEHVQNFLLREISEVTKSAWEDFGDVVKKWIEWSALVVLAKVDGKVVGFNATAFENDKVLIILASFVLPEYQSDKIVKKMQNLMIKKFFLHRGLSRLLEPAWFTFRTQNPRVMQMASKFHASPRLNGRPPSLDEVTIAKNVAARFSPHCEFDEKNFVLKGALKDKPDLLSQDKVFYSRSEEMNAFCDKHMLYGKKAGHLFIPVGRLTWIHKAYFILLH